MFSVVLVEPEIPQNTGNIARLCAAAEMQLIIAGKPSFVLHDSHLKRAGLDYWEYVRIQHQPDLSAFLAGLDMSPTGRFFSLWSGNGRVAPLAIRSLPRSLLYYSHEKSPGPQPELSHQRGNCDVSYVGVV
jgi:tRNA (cytidine/uridine-2'-O-)-methyltransferase